MRWLGIYKTDQLPVLEENQCALLQWNEWTVYETTGGLAFKRAYKLKYGVWPKGRWPFYSEDDSDNG